MIHLWNAQKRISDHTVNQYHNHKFAVLAQQLGFYVYDHPTRGLEKISVKPLPNVIPALSPKPENQTYLERTLDGVIFDPKIFSATQLELNQNLRGKQFQIKYQCQCPGPLNTVRSGRRPDGKRPLRVRCLDCGHPFVPVENN
jgi:hypothetical protein